MPFLIGRIIARHHRHHRHCNIPPPVCVPCLRLCVFAAPVGLLAQLCVSNDRSIRLTYSSSSSDASESTSSRRKQVSTGMLMSTVAPGRSTRRAHYSRQQRHHDDDSQLMLLREKPLRELPKCSMNVQRCWHRIAARLRTKHSYNVPAKAMPARRALALRLLFRRPCSSRRHVAPAPRPAAGQRHGAGAAGG